MVEIICKLAAPLLSAIIGIWLEGVFNVFEEIPFVPADYAYEVCITAYFAFVDALLEVIKDKAANWLKNEFFSFVEVAFCPPNTEVTESSIDFNPLLGFNEMDLTEICISVRIKGKKRHLKNSMLQVKSPAFVDFQENYKRTEVQVENGIYTIDLEKLFGSSDGPEFTQSFRLLMAKMPVDGKSTATIMPEIKGKHKNVIYKHNKATIKVDG